MRALFLQSARNLLIGPRDLWGNLRLRPLKISLFPFVPLYSPLFRVAIARPYCESSSSRSSRLTGKPLKTPSFSAIFALFKVLMLFING